MIGGRVAWQQGEPPPTTMAERALMIIKPDGIQRHLAGEIISRFEKKGFKLVAARFFRVCKDLARRLYAAHTGKDFCQPLVKCLSSEPVLVTVSEGQRVTTVTRRMMGATSGYEAQPGTIHGDFGCSQRYDLVHGSDSPESAEREIAPFFKPEEIVEHELSDDEWVFGKR